MNLVRSSVLFVALGVAATACGSRDQEKRIAELEAELAAVKGQKKEAPNELDALSTAAPSPETAPITEEKPTGPLPVAQFAKVEHDFGTINEGQSVEYTFQVKNTGEAPLIIQKADPSCGCTVPDWTKDPIAPGSSGFVKAKFDSSGKTGMQNKTITVTANTWPKQTVLRFKANVTPKASDAGPVK